MACCRAFKSEKKAVGQFLGVNSSKLIQIQKYSTKNIKLNRKTARYPFVLTEEKDIVRNQALGALFETKYNCSGDADGQKEQTCTSVV